MNKCEHGQKITTFCASQCCVWKQAAGCDLCIKKYHNHIGSTIFLNEQDINGLVKRFSMDHNIKPKCRLLQQAIYNYFNFVKTELTNSIDVCCKNIINQIGYPYLYCTNTLSTFKRIKNKQYRKLQQKQFRTLYELTLKVNQKQMAREQAKIYVREMGVTLDLLNNLEKVIKNYESIIKLYNPSFTHDGSYIVKIQDVVKTLNVESPTKTTHKARESQISQISKMGLSSILVRESVMLSVDQKNDSRMIQKSKEKEKERERQRQKQRQRQREREKEREKQRDRQKEKEKEKEKERQKQKQKEKEKQRERNTNEFQSNRMNNMLLTPPGNKAIFGRNVSLDKKIVKQHKFSASEMKDSVKQKQAEREKQAQKAKQRQKQRQKQREKQKQRQKQREKQKQRQKQKEYLKDKQKHRSQRDLQTITTNNSQKIQNLKLQLNFKQMQINEKKRMLIDMMKSKDDNNNPFKPNNDKPFDSFDKKDYSSKRVKTNTNTNTQTASVFKRGDYDSMEGSNSSSQSNRELSDMEMNGKIKENDKTYAFTKLPVQDNSSLRKKTEQRQQVKKKLIIVPALTGLKDLQSKQLAQIDSPLYKKKSNLSRRQQISLKDKIVQQQKQLESNLVALQNKITQYSSRKDQVLQLKQNQQKSIALLLKSLALKAEEAVTYLESAMKYADNNLSAAEYLSYIYLELNRPKDSLNLCNKILQKIQNSQQSQQLTLIISNNKAAALNNLGRYSQSILVLQKCLKYKQKDTIYKNLGDAYLSVGKLQTAQQYYQKAVQMNDQYDQAAYNMAVCLFLLNDFNSARLSAIQALQVQPKNQNYQELLTNIVSKLNSQ